MCDVGEKRADRLGNLAHVGGFGVHQPSEPNEHVDYRIIVGHPAAGGAIPPLSSSAPTTLPVPVKRAAVLIVGMAHASAPKNSGGSDQQPTGRVCNRHGRGVIID